MRRVVFLIGTVLALLLIFAGFGLIRKGGIRNQPRKQPEAKSDARDAVSKIYDEEKASGGSASQEQAVQEAKRKFLDLVHQIETKVNVEGYCPMMLVTDPLVKELERLVLANRFLVNVIARMTREMALFDPVIQVLLFGVYALEKPVQVELFFQHYDIFNRSLKSATSPADALELVADMRSEARGVRHEAALSLEISGLAFHPDVWPQVARVLLESSDLALRSQIIRDLPVQLPQTQHVTDIVNTLTAMYRANDAPGVKESLLLYFGFVLRENAGTQVSPIEELLSDEFIRLAGSTQADPRQLGRIARALSGRADSLRPEMKRALMVVVRSDQWPEAFHAALDLLLPEKASAADASRFQDSVAFLLQEAHHSTDIAKKRHIVMKLGQVMPLDELKQKLPNDPASAMVISELEEDKRLREWLQRRYGK